MQTAKWFTRIVVQILIYPVVTFVVIGAFAAFYPGAHIVYTLFSYGFGFWVSYLAAKRVPGPKSHLTDLERLIRLKERK